MLDKENKSGEAAPEVKVPRLTLGEYLAEAGKALRTNLPKAWVEAVVLDAKATRSGLSLELIEPMADERHDGRLRCQLGHGRRPSSKPKSACRSMQRR